MTICFISLLAWFCLRFVYLLLVLPSLYLLSVHSPKIETFWVVTNSCSVSCLHELAKQSSIKDQSSCGHPRLSKPDSCKHTAAKSVSKVEIWKEDTAKYEEKLAEYNVTCNIMQLKFLNAGADPLTNSMSAFSTVLSLVSFVLSELRDVGSDRRTPTVRSPFLRTRNLDFTAGD